VARWTGTWLEGPGATLGEIRRGQDGWLGKSLGLPKEGPASVASFSARLAAFVLDIFASALVAGLVVSGMSDPSDLTRQLVPYVVLFVEHVVLVGLTGQTLGMRLLSLKVVRLKDVTRPPGFVPALLRTTPLLLSVGILGLVSRDGRGLHDVLAGCVVVRD
jgi:uncharacterized RDD family membrane protein YckC